jgi:hypothetical protein
MRRLIFPTCALLLLVVVALATPNTGRAQEPCNNSICDYGVSCSYWPGMDCHTHNYLECYHYMCQEGDG